MIIKGNRHNNGPKLARYITAGEHGERAELAEFRGFASENIVDAFRDVHNMADARGIENPFFHVQVRLPEGEELNPEQWQQAADRIEKRLGLTGQARAVVFHIDEQTGERHMHLAFSLIDEDTLKAKPLPFFKFRLKALARELEKEFDISRVKNERDGPIQFGAKKNEQQQAERLGVDKDEIRNTIRACWEQSDCGKSFQAALEHEGMLLAQGDRRGLVVVDYAGGVHALGKRILDVNKATILDRLADIDVKELPTVQQAQSVIREMRAELQPEPQPRPEKEPKPWDRDRDNQRWEDAVINAAIEQEKVEREFTAPAERGRPKAWAGGREKGNEAPLEQTASDPRGQFKDARQETAGGPQRPLREIEKNLWSLYRTDPNDFAAALDSQGIAFARVTGEEANKSYREAQFAKAIGRIAPAYQEGEIVVVRTSGPEYLRQGERTEANRVYRVDQAHAEKYLDILSLDKSKLKGIEATKTMLDASAQTRTAYWQEIRLDNATRQNHSAPERNPKDRTAEKIIDTGASVAFSTLGKGLDIVGSIFESLLAPTLTPEQKREGELTRQERAADTAQALDFSRYTAERAQEQRSHKEQQAARDRQRELDRDR